MAEIAAIEREIPERVKVMVGGRAARALTESRAQIQQDLALLDAVLSR